MICALTRRLRSDESGFTMVEILVAATLAAVGIMALASGFESSRSMVSLAERNEAASHQAQKQLEKVLALDYEETALTSAPASSDDPNHPGYHVNAGEYRWDQESQWESLVVDPTAGRIDAVQTWSDGRLSGSVHVYVTNVFDGAVVQTPDEPDARRVTVAVTVNGDGGPDKPVLMSSMTYDKGAP